MADHLQSPRLDDNNCDKEGLALHKQFDDKPSESQPYLVARLSLNSFALADIFHECVEGITADFARKQIVNRISKTKMKIDNFVLNTGRKLCIRKLHRTIPSLTAEKIITHDMVNPCVKKMKFEVRGPLLLRALEIQEELAKGIKKPFTNVIRANIGDCHATGQQPITYLRQLLAACTFPKLMDTDYIPSDLKKRAQEILSCCDGNSLGAYSDAWGIKCLREHAAEYIHKRDGHSCDYKNILSSAGATDAIRSVLKVITNTDNKTGIMIPIPQYPLYSAAIAEHGAYQVNYPLNEDQDWGIDESSLQETFDEAKKHCNPKAIVVINPGNPTGQVLLKKDVEAVIRFAHKNRLLIMADEVYQFNIYVDDRTFVSFRKCLIEMGKPYSDMELVSFFSASKGYTGECGARGGYFECLNFDPTVIAELVKLMSTPLCPSVWGQALTCGIVNPPAEGEPSYALFKKESSQILKDLRTKAELVTELLNKMEGVKCNKVMGAMYAFPKLTLPTKFLQKAKERNVPADALYCRKILENTGICILPGTGFLQLPGTYHFRTTILPQVDQIKILLDRLGQYHKKLMLEYK
ncbi:hypothetical protein GJ496_002484 [Pomphorhynchus laevis]|nr:hypothetical protein GJ496_002484 [Pomphorhynchus laevis]